MKPDHDGWALKFPDGSISAIMLGLTQDDCWAASFPHVCAEVNGFESKWWKKWNPSIRAAARLGYHMVPVKIVEVK